MQLPTILTPFIAFSITLVGLMFLYLPERIRPIETWLNTPIGNREMAALRLGLQGERRIEQFLNRSVLPQQIVWDSWLLQHSRVSGLAFCALALWLVVSA